MPPSSITAHQISSLLSASLHALRSRTLGQGLCGCDAHRCCGRSHQVGRVEGGVLHPAMYILLEGAMMAIFCQAFSFRPRFKANPAVALWESRLAVPAFAVAVALTLIVG